MASLTLITSLKVLSPNPDTFRDTGVRSFNHGFWGTWIQPVTHYHEHLYFPFVLFVIQWVMNVAVCGPCYVLCTPGATEREMCPCPHGDCASGCVCVCVCKPLSCVLLIATHRL